MLTQNLGYPRIGANRELKKACESYWKGSISPEELENAGREIRRKNWILQKEAGMDIIPSNDFSYYDQIADWSVALNVIPQRFRPLEERLSPMDSYFALCRGYQKDGFDVTPLEMTKWFDTNYHYMVPEFSKSQSFSFRGSKVIDEFREALQLGIKTKPVLPGPFSFLKLGKEKEVGFNRLDLIHILLPVYLEIVGQLEDAGADCIQIDEPFLVTDLTDYEKQLCRIALTELFGSFPGVRFVLATYFGGVSHNFDIIRKLPLEVLHIDLVRDRNQIDGILEQMPDSLSLSLGIVDGRNIWKNDLCRSLEIIEKAVAKIGPDRVILAPSCSLLHVPYDLDTEKEEKGLPRNVKQIMAFAVQKTGEVNLLADLVQESPSDSAMRKMKETAEIFSAWRESDIVNNSEVKQKVAAINDSMAISRNSPFDKRIKIQQERLKLPVYPTTMIGSLPQTNELRIIRRKYKNNEIDENEYRSFINNEVKKAVEWQEQLGFDVLVHGEFERNDMVEFFGERLKGFAFTQNGWVQSYGSRCVKPPVIYGDISRKGPMTVDVARLAQSFTSKPVKGMLTGPVTILQWSFVRVDQPRRTTAKQIALAIRDEVLDLERSGIRVIQIDEPALREGLPLRKADWQEYLNWAVRAFRLSCWGVKDTTQIHTHMCYAEFNDIIDAIGDMDADVISIEASRSQMELLEVFSRTSYPNQIGPGVYDIHSPRIPSVDEIKGLILAASEHIDSGQLWVNPDCGLKTRSWKEVIPSITNIIEAAKSLR